MIPTTPERGPREHPCPSPASSATCEEPGLVGAVLALGSPVAAAISREALDDNFGTAGTSGHSKEERLETFRKNRSAIELMARHKYLYSGR
jgi:Protein of unknown function (DUF1488)